MGKPLFKDFSGMLIPVDSIKPNPTPYVISLLSKLDIKQARLLNARWWVKDEEMYGTQKTWEQAIKAYSQISKELK